MVYFSKDRYFEAQGIDRYAAGISKVWVDYCDGQPVTKRGVLFVCQPDGCPEEEFYVIHPIWVKEEN